MWSKAQEVRKFITDNSWTIAFVAAVIALSAVSLAVTFWAIGYLT